MARIHPLLEDVLNDWKADALARFAPSKPLQFPASRMVPDIDVTEWAVLEVGQLAKDFEDAIKAATSVSRAIQLRERIGACRLMLTAVEDLALARTDEF